MQKTPPFTLLNFSTAIKTLNPHFYPHMMRKKLPQDWNNFESTYNLELVNRLKLLQLVIFDLNLELWLGV